MMHRSFIRPQMKNEPFVKMAIEKYYILDIICV